MEVPQRTYACRCTVSGKTNLVNRGGGSQIERVSLQYKPLQSNHANVSVGAQRGNGPLSAREPRGSDNTISGVYSSTVVLRKILQKVRWSPVSMIRGSGMRRTILGIAVTAANYAIAAILQSLLPPHQAAARGA